MASLRTLVIGLVLLGFTSTAYGLPTPVDSKIEWNAYSGSATGFYLYWAVESPTRTYVDARKVDLNKPGSPVITVITVMPTAEDRLCFKMTAYRRATGQPEIESSFSNEACGNFGIVGPTGLVTKP